MLELFTDNIIGTLSLLASLAVINFIIIFHELGHYCAALKSGIVAESVCVGFGRLIFETKDKNGTRWQCRLWPFGGYVDLIGESQKKLKAYLKLPYQDKALILMGGIIANCLLACILFTMCHMIGYEQRVPKVAGIEHGSIIERTGMKAGDTIIKVNGDVVDSWQDVMYALINATAYESPVKFTVKRDGLRGRYQLKPFMTGQLFDANKFEGKRSILQRLGIEAASAPWPAVIDAVEKGSPAAKAGITPGDEIVTFQGKKIDVAYEFLLMIKENPDKKVEVTLLRNGTLKKKEIHLSSKGILQKTGFIGVRIEPAQKDLSLYRNIKSRTIFEGLSNGMEDCVRFLIIQCSTIYLLFTGALSLNMLGGPVIIIAQTFHLFDLDNIVYLLNWMAIINISLAFINILPIPIFDGGRLVLISIELIKGKPLKTSTINAIDRVTFAAILGLAAMVTFNDIMRVLGVAP